MSTASILLGLALAIVVLPFVMEPFWRRGRGSRHLALAAPADTAVPSKEAALIAVRDLDFDFQTGKVTEADYQPLRQQLLLAAAQAASAEAARRPATRTSRHARLDDDIESAVRKLRLGGQAARQPAPQTCAACGTAAAGTDRFCGHCGEALGLACPNCRAAVQPTDRFCAGCGATLKTKMESES
jgi:hypothetical protein